MATAAAAPAAAATAADAAALAAAPAATPAGIPEQAGSDVAALKEQLATAVKDKEDAIAVWKARAEKMRVAAKEAKEQIALLKSVKSVGGSDAQESASGEQENGAGAQQLARRVVVELEHLACRTAGIPSTEQLPRRGPPRAQPARLGRLQQVAAAGQIVRVAFF